MRIKRCCYSFIFLSTALALVPLAAIFIWSGAAKAQPIPDTTVGTEITPFDQDTSIIEGGTTVEQNLFHSFESFSIDLGERVFFFGPNDVNHIFSRVTGDDPSQIDGVLGTFGSDADLFLINPNGVVLGPEASLSVQGSFMATTADGVQLGTDGQFSVLDPGSDSLLAINPSAFLFSGLTPPNNILINQSILGVPIGESLVFLGGDIVIDGGQLFAVDGQIEIGALSAVDTIGFSVVNHSLLLSDNNVSRANIQLINGAALSAFNVFSDQKGEISLFADTINLDQASTITIGIGPNLDIGNQQVGNIEINATGDVTLSNESRLLSGVLGSLENGDLSIGQSGDIHVIADNLSLINGAGISSVLSGVGATGNITLTIQDRLVLDGTAGRPDRPSVISTGIFQGAEGQGGDVNILANTVDIINGANIFTNSFGIGDSGNIIISAQEQVLFMDGNATSGVGNTARGNGGDVLISAATLDLLEGSSILTDTNGIGNAGNIQLVLSDRVTLSGNNSSGIISSEVENQGQGNGGNIEIFANSLDVLNVGQIIAGTEGIGNGGNIVLNIRGLAIFDGERIEETGRVRSSALSFVGENAQGSSGNLEISVGSLEITNGAGLDVSTLGNGSAGNVIINADDYVRLNRGDIRAESLSSRSAGNLAITAGTLFLENTSFLSTSTDNAVNGGNISLMIDNLLLLRDRVDIRATAGNLVTGGNGGNISITTPFIIAISTENSDIVANAFEGSGGKVNITAQGVFGIEPRPMRTPLSDITASSQSGVSGIVAINSLDTSFIQDGLTTLPAQFINPDKLISNSCVEPNQTSASTFTITGGNLSETPNNRPTDLYLTSTVQSLNTAENISGPTNHIFIEPSSIYRTTDGRLVMGRTCSNL